MLKNPITLAVAALAVLTTIAMTAMSPASASSYRTSVGYFPDQFVNQGTAVESVPADSFGDSGLSAAFPVEAPVNLEDAAPQMYS